MEPKENHDKMRKNVIVKEKSKLLDDQSNDLVEIEKKVAIMRQSLYPKDEEDTYFD